MHCNSWEHRIVATRDNYNFIVLNETKIGTDRVPTGIQEYHYVFKNMDTHRGGVVIYYKTSIQITEIVKQIKSKILRYKLSTQYF